MTVQYDKRYYIDSTLEDLSRSSSHLDLHTRQRLWDALGPTNDDVKGGNVTVPHRRRFALMYMCLEKVYPLWTKAQEASHEPLLADRDDPRNIAQIALLRIDGRASWSDTAKTAERFGTLVNYLYELHENFAQAGFVVETAIGVVSAALRDLPRYEPCDQEFDYDAWTADTYASWAWCGFTPWDARNDERSDAARREFWTWYVTDAFSRAWDIDRT